MPTEKQIAQWTEEMRRVNDPQAVWPERAKRQKLPKTVLDAIHAALKAARLEACTTPQEVQEAMRPYLEAFVCKPLEEVLRFSAGEIPPLKLTASQQTALRLREEGKTFREIGQVLGVGTSMARQHFVKAERRAREIHRPV